MPIRGVADAAARLTDEGTEGTVYRFIEFPKHVHRAGGLYLEVADQEAEALALANGWHSVPPVEGEAPAAAGELDEAAALEKARRRVRRAS